MKSTAFTLITVLLGVYPLASCEPSCEKALARTKEHVDAVCTERAFTDNPICAVCRDEGFYSIDDTCTCRVLNFNTDQCYYADDKHAALPDVREALLHARDVCADRTVRLPTSGAGGEGGDRARAAD